MSELPLAAPTPRSPLHYPESDGAPMGETGDHIEAIIDLLAQLRHRYRDRDDVYVGSNQFLYYAEGDPKQVTCPDIYLAFGRPSRPLRPTWKVWEEDGHVPDLMVEVTSTSSKHTDLGAKRGLFESLGVREYVLFDPLDEYLEPRLQGFRLVDGRFAPIDRSPAGLHLQTVGLWLRADGARVQGWNEDGTRAPAPWRDYDDLVDRLTASRAALDAAERAAAEAERAAADAERAKADAEHAAAHAERVAADAERAKREVQRALDDERARVAALQAELRRLRGD